MNQKDRLVSANGLLLVFAVVLLLTGRLSAGEHDAKVEKAAKALGGSIERDDRAKGKPITGVDLSLTGATDAALRGLAGLKNLRRLDLHETKVSDAGLKELVDLKNLHFLDLRGTKVTDAGLKELAELKKLEILVLYGTQLTDAG